MSGRSFAGSFAAAAGVTVLSMIGGCAATSPRYALDIDRKVAEADDSSWSVPADADPEPQPWQLGQWARYQRREGGEVAIEEIAVVAQDSCGTWIEWVDERADSRTVSLLCFHAEPEAIPDPRAVADRLLVAIDHWNEPRPSVTDFRPRTRERQKRRFHRLFVALAAPWAHVPNAPRANLRVGTSQFVGAIRVDGPDGVQWFHPDAPFGGRIKASERGIEYTLLDYGEGEHGFGLVKLRREIPRTAPAPEMFLGLGAGVSWLPRVASETASGAATAWSVQFDMRLARKLHLVVDMGGASDARYSPDPSMRHHVFYDLLGVRWPAVSRLYVDAAVGYAELSRDSPTSTDTVARGLGFGAGVGWLQPVSEDWAATLEVSDHIARFEGQDLRHAIAVVLGVQLALPWQVAPGGG